MWEKVPHLKIWKWNFLFRRCSSVAFLTELQQFILAEELPFPGQQCYPWDDFYTHESRKEDFRKANLEGVCCGRAGQARRVPGTYKAGHLLLCVLLLHFLLCCLLFLGVPIREQASGVATPALRRQTNREKPSAAECLVLAEMPARDEISPVFAEACLWAVHVEGHWLMVRETSSAPACQDPRGDSQPPHSCTMLLAFGSLPSVIYLIYLYFVWKRLICFSSQTQVFLSAPARSYSHKFWEPL